MCIFNFSRCRVSEKNGESFFCLLFKVHTDNSEEGFFGNFRRGQVNPNQPLFKIIIATGVGAQRFLRKKCYGCYSPTVLRRQ